MCFIPRLVRIFKLAATACVGFGDTQEVSTVTTTTTTCAAGDTYKFCTQLPHGCQGRGSELRACYSHDFYMEGAYPRLIDWDGDEDLDLVVSDTDGKVHYYERNANGTLDPRTHANPFQEVYAGNHIAAPAFFDWDNDGDKDMLVTSAAGEIYYYEHDQFHQIVQKFGDDNPFQSIRLDADISPVVVVIDWNGDQYLDLIVSYPSRGLVYYQQGSDTWVETSLAENPFKSVPVFQDASPEVVDWDGDGDLDFILSSGVEGRLYYFEQLYDGSLLDRRGFFGHIEAGDNPSVQVADWNGDGILDLLLGSTTQSLRYYQQTHTGEICSPTQACGENGICEIVDEVGVCMCLQGRRLADCSGCDSGFFSAEAKPGHARSCTHCPTSPLGHICGRRGYCLDDERALESGGGESSLHPVGAGTCVCSDPFEGTTCLEGQCAPGWVATYIDEEGEEKCIWQHESTGIIIGLNVIVCLIFFFAPYLFSLPCWICDISSRPECKGIVVRTSRHFILEYGRMPLVFSGTGVTWLDQPSSTIMGRAVGGREIHIDWPTAANGDLLPAAHSSIGQVRIARPSGMIFSGLFVLPLFVWHGILAGIFVSILYQKKELVETLMEISLIPGLVLALFAHIARWKVFSKTEIQSELQEYSQKLAVARSNKKPVPCAPGPERAVNAGQISDLSEFFSPRLQLQRSMYYVCPNIVLPLTRRYRLSYAEVAGQGMVSWFISHFWGMPFLDFVTGLKKHARSSSGNSQWRDSWYWICTFSNNQWALELEIPPGRDPTHSSFYKALVSPTCRGTCMVLDENVTPLRRSWCLYELLLTLQSIGSGLQEGEFEGLLLLTASGVLNTGRASMDTALQMGRELALLRLEDATASRSSDKLMIDEFVQGMPGGFATINRQLKTKISEVLAACAKGFNDDFLDLTNQLSEAVTLDPEKSPDHTSEAL